MTLQQVIENYGYYAVFFGSMLEGETLLVMAGFAAHRGYLELPWVIACAGAGGFLGDQFYFYLGRRHRAFALRRFRSIGRHVARIDRLLARFDTPVIILVRFMYGLRTAGPAVIGMSKIAAWRFVLFNFIGAALWSALIGGIGFLFGRGLETVLSNVHRYEMLILAAIALVGGAAGMIGYLRRRESKHDD